MINIYRSRRDYNLRCEYWKADSQHTAKEQLEYGNRPNGVFYAKYASGKYATNSQAGNVFQTEVNTITIKTPDDADLSPNDIVDIRGERWIVQNSQKIHDRKNEYHDLVEQTVVYLRKGIA